MKLDRIEVKNYRSLYHDYESEQSFALDLGDGMNAIAGPNNVGKSNVLRALSLALDPTFRFDRALDMPATLTWSKPTVTLTFRVPNRGRPSRESTLLKLVDEYERKVNPSANRTYADEGEIRLRVTIEGADESTGTRRSVFVVRGGGARSLNDDDPVARKALESFHRCLHFVKIDSGQSLESLLEGKFRDILHNVLKEDLRTEFDAADQLRSRYSEDLRTGLLKRLSERINAEVKKLFPEIEGVSLSPEVPSLEETLAKMRVEVSDVAVTDLADKGTGVRGGLIIAMLRHFADVGKRSMLFAVEEPESFLHPAAQEQLREGLEALATRRDISLVVTTHSPYIVSRKPGSRVFGLDKGKDGGTILKAQADGSEPHAAVLGGLYRDSLVMEWLDRAEELPAGAQLIIVVEGDTDRDYAVLAAERAGRPELLQGISFRLAGSQSGGAGGGAAMAVMQALVTHAAAPIPVAVVLDNDQPGQEAANTLRQIGTKTNLWRHDKELFSYRTAFESGSKAFGYEAEDLWPDHLLEGFLKQNPEADRGRTVRPKPTGGWQWHIDAPWKGEFVEYLRAHATAEDCERWISFIDQIRKGSGLGPVDPVTAPADPSGAGASVSTPGETLAKPWAPRRDFLFAVRDVIAPPLEAAGLRPANPHARGAYIRVDLGPSCGPYAAHHLSVRARKDRATVALVVNAEQTTDQNVAVLEAIRLASQDTVADYLPTTPSEWGPGQADAIRAVAVSEAPGFGYDEGDVTAAGEWIRDMCLGWSSLLGALANNASPSSSDIEGS